MASCVQFLVTFPSQIDSKEIIKTENKVMETQTSHNSSNDSRNSPIVIVNPSDKPFEEWMDNGNDKNKDKVLTSAQSELSLKSTQSFVDNENGENIENSSTNIDKLPDDTKKAQSSSRAKANEKEELKAEALKTLEQLRAKQPLTPEPETVQKVEYFEPEKKLTNILNKHDVKSTFFKIRSESIDEKQSFFIQAMFLVPVIDSKVDDIYFDLQYAGFGKIKGTSISVFNPFLHENSIFNDEVSTEEIVKGEAVATTESPDSSPNKNESEKLIATKNMEEKRKEAIRKSTNCIIFAQVVNDMGSKVSLTSDYVCLIIIASIMSAIGLIENSSVVLVASMLVSPLMSPILGATFCTVIKKWDLVKTGLFVALLGLFFCLLVGFIFGILTAFINKSSVTWGVGTWPTQEMSNRGLLRGLWIGVLIAVPSGIGVAISSLNINISSLVGVAISASLLPPAVNCGMLWANGFVYHFSPPNILRDYNDYHLNDTNKTGIDISEITKMAIKADHCNILKSHKYETFYTCDYSKDLAILGSVSLLLTIVNIVCIFLVAILVFFLKGVTICTRHQHLDSKDYKDNDLLTDSNLKFAREYNKTIKGKDGWKLGVVAETIATKNQLNPVDLTDNLRFRGHPKAADQITANYFKTISKESNVDVENDLLHPQYHETLGLHNLFENKKRRVVFLDENEHAVHELHSPKGRFVVKRQNTLRLNEDDKIRNNPYRKTSNVGVVFNSNNENIENVESKL